MVEFYKALEPDPNHTKPRKPTALREAALGLLEDSRYRHPFYWAGFVLIGSCD